jgi:hypothetical protein
MDPKRRLVSKSDGDFFSNFGQQIRLLIRLIGDPRVSLWIANTLFLELVPQELVDEHRLRLEKEAQPKKESPPLPVDESDVIEARYRDKDNE